MAGLGAKDILRNITALEQLIEEINFQRAKEMRQCLMSKDSDVGFVMVHGTTYWTDLFVRHFLFQTDRSTDADDLLFFIRKKQMKGSRYIPKYQTEVEVYRKDSRKLPIGDPDIDWEETVYLNLIIHQFDYTLTLAICTRTSPKELQVLKRHSQKVYASPSRRRMDTKGEVEEITYPNVCFHVDNFDEVFADMLVRDGEMVCVELVASDHGGSRQAVIFLGSIRYDALKRVYDARASLSSKVAQRMMMGLFTGSSSQRIEFVRMKGPQGKGHAEMAVTKPKGSGVETPTSEPGVSLTDLWDSDWDDEPEDRFLYRHQRRLSDPSANFNTFINSGWVSRAEAKSRSENEGLDAFANGLYEIESGDVRDAASSCRCCSMVACRTSLEEDESGLEFGQGICPQCKHFHGRQTTVTSPGHLLTRHRASSFDVPVVHEISLKSKTDGMISENVQSSVDCKQDDNIQTKMSVYKDQSAVCVDAESDICSKSSEVHDISEDGLDVVEGIEASEDMETAFCSVCLSQRDITGVGNCNCKLQGVDLLLENNSESQSPEPCRPNSPDETDPFLIHDVAFAGGKSVNLKSVKEGRNPITEESDDIKFSRSRNHSRIFKVFSRRKKKTSPGSAVRVVSSNSGRCDTQPPKDYIPLSTAEDIAYGQNIYDCSAPQQASETCSSPVPSSVPFDTGQRLDKKGYLSGPMYYRSFSLDLRQLEKQLLIQVPSTRIVRSVSCDSVRISPSKKTFKRHISVPFRVTKDGTKVYFLCDLKLDDGAYNPLWTSKGFTQTFHFWKESRRAQSVPLNAYLTYVTLPWFTIITDILDHRTGPILTF